MNRLQKKCFLASATMHFLLLILLFVGPAFFVSEKKPEFLPVLTFIPSKAVDDAMFGGGNPKAAPPAAAKQPEVAPAPPPAQPPPEPVRPERRVVPQPAPTPKKVEPTPTKPKPKETPRLKPDQAVTSPKEKPAKTKPQIEAQFPSPADAVREKAEERRRADLRAKAERANRLRALSESLNQNLSPGTSIEPLGPGGEAFANYKLIVQARYQEAWVPPSEFEDESADVEARVVILRDGTVSSAVIIKPSGHPALDASVRRALQLKFIAPFPEGAKDTERTFNIHFNLKAKRLSG